MKICHRFSALLINVFDRLGRLVSRHPKKIIVVSIISTILMTMGIIKVRTVRDVRYMIAPTNSRGYDEKRIAEQLFPIHSSKNWNLYRLTEFQKASSVIIVPVDRGNVLKKSIFEEASLLDWMIRSFRIEWKGKTYNYSDICIKTDGTCFDNVALQYKNEFDEEGITIKYPLMIDMKNLQFNVTSIAFGGVTVGGSGDIVEAKALRLFYFLDETNTDKRELIEKWENEYINMIERHKSKQIIVIKFSMVELDKQFAEQSILSVQYGTVGFTLVFTVSVLSSMTSDWVTSKPLLTLAGCISPLFAILASLGVIAVLDVPITALNFALPLVITGIGIDDMFVLIAAWRKTDRKESVVNRMGETYSHAAVSVTMTSLTNLITFLVGASMPIPLTRNFCIQGAFAMFFDWLYQLIFFGSCMALDGHREEKNLHPLTFTPLELEQDASEKSCIHRVLFTRKPDTSGSNFPMPMIWFRDKLGGLMNLTWMKAIILLFLVVYLAGASWGFTQLEHGFKYENNFAYNTETYTYAKNFYEYFNKYNQPVQVIFRDNLDYSNRTVQRQMRHIMSSIQSSKYVSRIAFNWLQHFLLFTRINRQLVSSYNLSDPKEFNTCLREVFFKHRMGKFYKNDVIFNEDGVHISASRFIILPIGASELSEEVHLLKELRGIADSLPYSPTLFSVFWLYYEVFSIVQQIILQTITVAIISLIIAFFIFVPSFSDVICSAICIISIQFGVMGYMAIFGVKLNFLTTAVFVVCTGFCVDSSAHILNAFALAKGTLQERIKDMYFMAGMPVLQGSITTILSVLPLLCLQHYMFRMMVMIVCLQIIISFFHAIFVLPTLLTFRDNMVNSFKRFESKVGPSKMSNGTTKL